jgi:hypothetical protein
MVHTAAGATSDAALEPLALHTIPDLKPVRVYLPIKNRKQRYRTQAVYRTISPPLFELCFQPGSLPLDDLDNEQTCMINLDFGGPTMSMTAVIVSASRSNLRLEAEKLISHEQMREFFRVDTITEVISKSFQPAFYNREGDSWTLKGRTIDISGNGILASFAEMPPDDEFVRLELTLPDNASETVNLLARTVRSFQVDDQQWDIAFHFQDISMEDRDRIVACCLDLQRRLLRLRVDPPVQDVPR